MVVIAVLAMVSVACTSESDPEPAPTPSTSSAPVEKVRLTLGVFGNAAEIAAYQDVVDTFNSTSTTSTVAIRSWPSYADFTAALAGGQKPPDVFLTERRGLDYLRTYQLTQPVGDLLDERNVDLGDGYSRDALEAFAADNQLQCMPYGISPMVIFYNPDLVDFTKMEARGLTVPGSEEHNSWTFEAFTAAANFATKPRRKTRGLYIDPTLQGLAPFVLSGGGKLFNDEDPPTSTDFSDDSTRASLEKSLPLLRDPTQTLTPAQLAKASPLTWFKRGRLGMIAGHRSLVPELRGVAGLDFDVFPMPTIDDPATTADITGMCLSSKTTDQPEAADLLVNMISAESVTTVARTGYLVPANQVVARSDDFLQPTKLPVHANVFNNVRAVKDLPLGVDLVALEDALSESLENLLTVPVLDLDQATSDIDRASLDVLDPEAAAAAASAEASASADPDSDE